MPDSNDLPQAPVNPFGIEVSLPAIPLDVLNATLAAATRGVETLECSLRRYKEELTEYRESVIEDDIFHALEFVYEHLSCDDLAPLGWAYVDLETEVSILWVFSGPFDPSVETKVFSDPLLRVFNDPPLSLMTGSDWFPMGATSGQVYSLGHNRYHQYGNLSVSFLIRILERPTDEAILRIAKFKGILGLSWASDSVFYGGRNLAWRPGALKISRTITELASDLQYLSNFELKPQGPGYRDFDTVKQKLDQALQDLRTLMSDWDGPDRPTPSLWDRLQEKERNE